MKTLNKKKTGYFEIIREKSDLSFDDFMSNYFVPERPVIIENIGSNWPAKNLWNEDYVRERLVSEPNAKAASLWYWMDVGALDSDYQTPNIIERLLTSPEIFPRTHNMRIWIHSAGNVSNWHYDTNMVNVFNTQVTGQKEWFIVSPDTPLDCYPFINFTIIDGKAKTDLSKKKHSHFMLNEGDMLYLPPLWFHKVISKGEENISLNWILTKKETTVTSKTLTRELERFYLQSYLSNKPSLTTGSISKAISSQIPGFLRSRWRYQTMIITPHVRRRFDLIRRVFTELSVLGKVALHARKVRPYIENLKSVKKLDTPALENLDKCDS